MFRVESQIELLTHSGRYPATPDIQLRGYKDIDPVAAPAQFKESRPVSVGQVLGHCPTQRDLYLEKRLKVKVPGEKRKNRDWPRTVGKHIERALLHIYTSHEGDIQPCGSTLDEIAAVARARLDEYTATDRAEFDGLGTLPGAVLDNSDFRHMLADHILFDLFVHQGSLNFARSPNAGHKSLNALGMNPEPEEMPGTYLKLGKATPDFTLPKHRAIGDIKSGRWSDDYFMTAAGYALAFESIHKSNIDIGAIYLVETDPAIISQGRLVTFLLTDAIRNRFLDRRNDALMAVTEGAKVPRRLSTMQEQTRYCDTCAYKAECFRRNDFEGAA
jgi:CRISPR/Cas system-associated exonuclease Cas4 (RecB family)